MARAALLRKTASLLLVLCVVLPLSKCGPNKEEPVVGSPAVRAQGAAPLPAVDQFQVITFYGYEMLASDALDVGRGQLGKAGSFAIIFLAFFGPLATMRMREPLRSGAQFILAFPSLYFLTAITFFAIPQYGGMLALACWTALLILSTSTLWVAIARFLATRRAQKR